MRRWFFYFCSLFLIIACSNNEKNKIIPRKDLVPLLIDIHIHDALAMNYNINTQFGGLDSSILYSVVLQSYGYTKKDFEHTIEYYSGEPEKLIKIYDDVFSELSKKAEEAKSLYESYSPKNTKPYWKAKRSIYRIIGDTASYVSMFDFAVDTIGTFVINAEVRITEKDKSINPQMVAYFYNSSNDKPEERLYFDIVPLLRTTFKREYTLAQECTDKDYNRMRILLPKVENKNLTFFKDMEISNLQVSLVKEKEEQEN